MSLGIKALGTKILFTFVDDISNGAFDNKLSWGFEIRNRTEDVGQPRWGKVKSIGDAVEGIKLNEYILIEPLMWTLRMEHNGVNYWGTDVVKVIATSDTLPNL